MRLKVIVPFPFGREGVARRAAALPRFPDVEFEVVPVRDSIDADAPEAGRSAYESLILDVYVTEAALRAEEEGFDAVVIDTISDSGLAPLRSRLSIPVIGPGMTSYAVAMLLGKRFSVIVYRDVDRHFTERNLDTYKLWQRCASVRAAGVEPDWERLFGADREDHFERIADAARRALDEDGADTIVLGSTTMHEAAAHVRERLGVPVVDPAPVAVSVAVALVRLGLSHSKAAWPPPSIVQDDKLRSLGR
jgi:allantoin racemase